jgi:hypothetical protein
MHISLKRTILMSTALLTIYMPAIAMEGSTPAIDSDQAIPSPKATVIEQKSEPTIDPKLDAAISTRAQKISTNFFGSTAPDGTLSVFKEIAKLLIDKDSNGNIKIIKLNNIDENSKNKTLNTSQSNASESSSPYEQFLSNKESFTREQALLNINPHRFFSHPDFNTVYTLLMDNFLASTDTSNSLDVTERLKGICREFEQFITKIDANIIEYKKSGSGTTADVAQTLNGLISTQENDKKQLQKRLIEVLKHFATTRNYIVKARANIRIRQDIITATPKSLLQSTTVISETNQANELSLKNIYFLQQTILHAETLLHSLYPFRRTNKELSETSNVFTTMLTAIANSTITVVGKVINITPTRQLRCQITGESYLPSPVISAVFNEQTCLGATDKEVHTGYLNFINAMLEPTLALEDAVNDGRIGFISAPAKAQQTSAVAESTTGVQTATNSEGQKESNNKAEKMGAGALETSTSGNNAEIVSNAATTESTATSTATTESTATSTASAESTAAVPPASSSDLKKSKTKKDKTVKPAANAATNEA